MIEMFKLGYNRYDSVTTKGMFEFNNRDTITNDKKVITKKANSNCVKSFFFISSATNWNMLPGEVIDSKSLNAFKKTWTNTGRKNQVLQSGHLDESLLLSSTQSYRVPNNFSLCSTMKRKGEKIRNTLFEHTSNKISSNRVECVLEINFQKSIILTSKRVK